MLQSVSPKHDLPLKPEGQAAKPERTGTWAPFSIQAFRIIWICNLFANLGTWAQSVAAAWVVTDAHASPLMVAMIQVAAALPLVLLSILSGVIADNHDRRKIMLWGLSFEMTGAMFATLLAFLGYLDPVLLIISILWISLGGSVTIPAWQAAVNEQVPARMVSDAVLLNSVNYNVARAAGPALGGLLLSAVGPAWVFLFNSFCYMALIWAIWQWRRDVPKRSLPPEGILEGVTAALRFTQYSTVTRLVMMRSFAFGLSASAVWALLPLLAHRNPDGDAAIYGYMLGALGLGAILGSTQVSRLRQRIGSSRLVSLAGFTLALILLTLGLVDNLWVLFPVLILGGGCWIGALATYNSAVQILVPDWIKARALALYQTALYGGLALGSFLWGHLAETMTVHGALLAAGCLLLASVILLYNSRLPEMDAASISRAPASMPGQPSFVFNTRRGMVLVSIEYRIPAERTRDFVRAAQPLRRLRLRNGAERWSLFRDVSNPEVWQELFLVDNWIQHLRMLDRMTLADKIVIDNVTALHAGDGPPQIRHCVSYEASSYDTPLVKSATPPANDEAGATAGS
ncbi:TPA: MFS transporter [Pseudomonas aeruginosa]